MVVCCGVACLAAFRKQRRRLANLGRRLANKRAIGLVDGDALRSTHTVQYTISPSQDLPGISAPSTATATVTRNEGYRTRREGAQR